MTDAVRTDVTRVLIKHVPNPDRWDKIRRISDYLRKFAVDSAVNESLKAVTDFSENATPSFEEGFRGIEDYGRKKVHKIVQEGLKHLPPPHSPNDKKIKDLKLVMDELQAKMDGLQEDMNNVKQQNEVSAKCFNGSESSEPLKKIPNKGNKGLDLLKTNRKRVFIRSRL